MQAAVVSHMWVRQHVVQALLSPVFPAYVCWLQSQALPACFSLLQRISPLTSVPDTLHMVTRLSYQRQCRVPLACALQGLSVLYSATTRACSTLSAVLHGTSVLEVLSCSAVRCSEPSPHRGATKRLLTGGLPVSTRLFCLKICVCWHCNHHSHQCTADETMLAQDQTVNLCCSMLDRKPGKQAGP